MYSSVAVIHTLARSRLFACVAPPHLILGLRYAQHSARVGQQRRCILSLAWLAGAGYGFQHCLRLIREKKNENEKKEKKKQRTTIENDSYEKETFKAADKRLRDYMECLCFRYVSGHWRTALPEWSTAFPKSGTPAHMKKKKEHKLFCAMSGVTPHKEKKKRHKWK